MEHEKDRFVVYHQGTAATIAFELDEDKKEIHMVSTTVPDSFAGQGVGTLLAKAAFQHSLTNGLKIKNSCWFLDKYVTKHPQYKELMLPNQTETK